MISIIITTLNGGDTLMHLLESINKQTYKEIEVILIDAGSQDKTVEIYNNFCFHEGINKIFINNDNELNIVDSYRQGFKVSKGEFVMTIGHDDMFYDHDWLKYSINKLVNNSQIGLVWGRSLIQDENKINRDLIPNFDNSSIILTKAFTTALVLKQVPIDVNCVIRRSIFDQCFPKAYDNKIAITIPHLYIYKLFFELDFQTHFSSIIATRSIDQIDSANRRQIKFLQIEKKYSKIFFKQLRISFLILFFNMNFFKKKYLHVNINEKHYDKSFKYLFFIFYLLLNKYLKKFSIYRFINKQLNKYAYVQKL